MLRCMRRTQIYLDEDQKRALRSLAASLDSNVSDLIRRAVDRLLQEELPRKEWAKRLGDWQKRIRERYGDFPEGRVDGAYRAATKRGAKKTR
jgi:Arc/MetJ-type ribon-helix-helix transcriptional regulator